MMAKTVLQTHEEDYAAKPFPARPAAIALDDHELIDAYQLQEKGGKITADRRRALTYFGHWRYAVWAAESDAGMRLLGVVDAALVFEGQDFQIEADILFSFAEDQYSSFRRADAPRDLPWDQLRDWCLGRGRDYGLLTKYMRAMKHPKGGVPFHKPQGKRGGRPSISEHVPISDQEPMPWDEE